MKWTISTAIDSIIANPFLSRMHISMGKSIIIIEKERLIRERSSQEKYNHIVAHLLPHQLFKPRCEKTGLRGVRPGPTQTATEDG